MTTSDTPVEGRTGIPRGLVVVLSTAGLLISIVILRQLSSIVAPVLLALVLVIGVHPVRGMLLRRGAPGWLAGLLTLLALFAIILGLAAAFALSLAQLATILPDYQDQFIQLANDVKAWLATIGIGPDQIRAAIDKISLSSLSGLLTGLLAGLANAFSNVLFLLFVAAFMAVDAPHFARRLARVRGRYEVVNALGGFTRGTRSYLIVSTVFGLIVAVIDALFLWLVSVPLPVLWGLLAFVTNYIPNIGFVIGVIPPALLALLAGGPKLMITVIVAYSVINFVIQSVIQPKYVSDAVNLSLTLTFLSLVFWTFVIGALGAVLAIPLTLLTKALLLDVDPETRWISSLLASGPAPPDDEAGADTGEPAAAGTEPPAQATVSAREAEPEPDRGDPAGTGITTR